MDKIETTTSCHALTERVDVNADANGTRRGVTWCGKNVRGSTGTCIATMITCGACRRVMRARGWEV